MIILREKFQSSRSSFYLCERDCASKERDANKIDP